MDLLVMVIVAALAGMVGAMVVDAKFWWSFIQDIYYHYPGNHLCKRPGCCR